MSDVRRWAFSRLERDPTALRAAWIGLAGFVGFSVAAFAGGGALALALMLVGLVASLVGLVEWRASRKLTPVDVVIEDGFVALDGARWLALDAIARAALYTDTTGALVVRVEPKSKRVRPRDFVAPDVAQGRAFLEATGQDAAHRAARFALVPVTAAHRPVGCLVLIAFALALPVLVVAVVALVQGAFGGPLVAWTLGALAVVVLAVRGARSGVVDVGADGVRYTGFLGAGFVRFVDVERMRRVSIPRGQGVVLSLRSGRAVTLVAGSGRGELDEGAMFQTRIEDAWRAARRGAREDRSPLLARRPSEPALAWMARLRAEIDGGRADHRRAVASEDDLRAVADDATAPPLLRIVAVGALAAEPERRERLRFASESAASPAARSALAMAASGALEGTERERAELEAAVAEVEALEAAGEAAKAKSARR